LLARLIPRSRNKIAGRDHEKIKSSQEKYGVPLGKFRLQGWHPPFGTTDAGVAIVRDGEVGDINFDLKKK
jgi:hypothetical protein